MNGVWDTARLYASLGDPAFLADAQEAQSCLAAAKAAVEAEFDEALADWPDPIFAALGALERASEAHARPSVYVTLLALADSGDEAAQAQKHRFAEIRAELDIASDRLAERLLSLNNPARIADDPRAARYAFYLAQLEQERAHALPKALNACVHRMQTTGGHAFAQLRSQAETQAECELALDGETKKLPLPAVRALQSNPDPDVRRRAFEAEIKAEEGIAELCAACLNAIKGEAITVAGLRNFPSPLEWMLHVNRMTRATLEAMHAAIAESLPAFARYVRAKAKLLGCEGGLPYYELNTPVGKAGSRYTLESAADTIEAALSGVDAELGALAKQAFGQGWIDAYPRRGKYGGGICVPVPSLNESRIMVNFGGSFGDVVTIAHELGHAFHDRCTKDVPLFLRDAPTPVCETASTFNELIVYDAAEKDASPEERLFVLDALLAGAARNIADIYSRFLFEDAVFEERKAAPLTVRRLCSLMEDCQKTAYCGALDPAALHPYMWIAKPHYTIVNFHYYNFPYAFGLLFAQGLHAIRKAEPEGFMSRYRALLAATCEDALEGIAARVGIDVTERSFWRQSLAVFEEKIARFEEAAKDVAK